jgi:hypothetical protein
MAPHEQLCGHSECLFVAVSAESEVVLTVLTGFGRTKGHIPPGLTYRRGKFIRRARRPISINEDYL